MRSDVAIIGGGVLGVTTAFWLGELYACSIVVLEGDVATQTTLRNTGLAHRPYYMDPVKRRGFSPISPTEAPQRKAIQRPPEVQPRRYQHFDAEGNAACIETS